VQVEAPAALNARNALATFLKRVLPQEGSAAYIVSEKRRDGKWADHACDSIDVVAQRAVEFDAAGSDSYIALGVFKRNQSRVSRRQERVAALRSLWLDVDVGPSKPYKTQAEALGAQGTFCAVVGLPLPLVVSSGSGGLHVYFPFAAEVARDNWQRAADMLKALCAAHGFAADAACTSDAARVLRPIQTRNFKDQANPRPVALLAWGEVTQFDEIESVLSKACQQSGASASAARILEPRTIAPNGLNAQFLVPETYPPSRARKIADQCAQIRAFRAGARQSEPEWHASLALLRHTVESETIAHEWSSLDPRYRQTETAGKLARLKGEDIGPTTCARFASLNPSGCARCPHNGRITSPIELGHGREMADDGSATTPPTVPIPVAPATPLLPTTIETKPMSGLGATWPPSPQIVEPLFDIESARAGRFVYTKPKPREWLLRDCLPAGVVGSVVAMGGTGKSFLMIQVSASVATGTPFLDTWESENPGEVLVLMAEDDEVELHYRIHRVAQTLDNAYPGRNVCANIAQNIVVKSLVGESNLLTALSANREVTQTDRVARIIATGRQMKNLKLIIVDPASRFRGGVENSAEDVTRFIEALERIRAAFPNVTLLVVHHTNKWSGQAEEQTQGAARGSSAFSDAVRWQMNLAALNAKEAARVPAAERNLYLSATITKNNYGPPQAVVYLKRGDGGVLTKVSLEDAAGKKGAGILLRIVERVRNSEPMSADKFEAEFGGTTNVFGTGKLSLRGHIKQAIDAGYLTKAEAGRTKQLVVTDLGRAALSAIQTTAPKQVSIGDSPLRLDDQRKREIIVNKTIS
jgi:hypothetical protein